MKKNKKQKKKKTAVPTVWTELSKGQWSLLQLFHSVFAASSYMIEKAFEKDKYVQKKALKNLSNWGLRIGIIHRVGRGPWFITLQFDNASLHILI